MYDFTLSAEMRQVLENQMQILAALAYLNDDGQSPPCTIPLYLEYCVSQTRELLKKDDAKKAEIKRLIKIELAQLSNSDGATPPRPEPPVPPRYPVTICGVPQEDAPQT